MTRRGSDPNSLCGPGLAPQCPGDRVRTGFQYEYVKLTAFPGVPTGAGTPNAGLSPNTNIAFFLLRYYPFN